MNDAAFKVPKHTGTKPRLSLLSSKQAGIRLKSEDQPDQPQSTVSTVSIPAPPPPISATTTSINNDYANVASAGSDETTMEVGRKQVAETLGGTESKRLPQQLNGNAQSGGDNKLDISKEELIRLLSMLKSELQSKEIALAAIKCEQLKRLINPIEISRSSLANTYIELQDRFKERDQNNNSNNNIDSNNSRTKATEALLSSASGYESQRLGEQPDTSNKKQQLLEEDNNDNDRENLNILNTLLELLDQHPLLALPRDSIYCLDYNCNELSTKNYLNLKIQHLDNLINQHRRFRYYMNLRLKRSEQRFLNLTRELEIERRLRNDHERNLFKTSGKDTLLKHIDQLKEALEKEKKDKQAIVMTLLNELLDERERNEALVAKLNESKETGNSADSIENSGSGEKSKTESEKLSIQLEKQSICFAKDRDELQGKVAELRVENFRLKQKLDEYKERYEGITSAINSSPPSTPATSSPSRSSNPIGQRLPAIPPGKQVPQAPPVVSRASVGSTTPKHSPPQPTRTTNSNNATQNSSSRVVVNQTVSSNIGGSQAVTSSSRQSTTAPSSSGTNQRPSASPVVFKLVGASKAEQAPVRIQPLFKSASVLSTNPQVRNIKTSVSGGVGSGNGGQSNPPQLARSSSVTTTLSSSSTQPVTKPQVPAKPAQLLDQQRSSLN